MSAHRRVGFGIVAVLVLAVVLVALVAVQPAAAVHERGQLSVADVESLGVVTFPTGYEFAGTEVGGLSGIAFDPHRDVYYVVSDGDIPRFYTVDIDLSDGHLDEGDVTFLDVTVLRDRGNRPFPPGVVDAESIELVHFAHLYVSSEGDADAEPPIDPFVNRFTLLGRETHTLPVPDKFLPDEDKGIRDNLAFESLTKTPNTLSLYTAVENALKQDGPPATLTTESPSRVLEYSLLRKQPKREFVYTVSPIPEAPVPPTEFADNGLVELQALDNRGTFLAMERSFAVGVGNIVRLFETSIQGATDVSDVFALDPENGPVAYEPMPKELVADFEDDLGIDPDNLEGMRFGPDLPDGRKLLVVVSDNNFNPAQTTQFIALAVELERESARR